MKIVSPIATGNGAYILHKSIEKKVSGYDVIPFNPYRTFFPPSLYLLGRSRHADLVHTTPDYGFFHVRKKVPLILTFHGYMLDNYVAPYSSRLQNLHRCTDLRLFTCLAVKNATLLTAVSQFTADLAAKDLALQQKIKVIYNGVDEEKFTPGKKKIGKNIKVLFSGNLKQRKGVQWLIPILDKLDSNISVYYTQGLRSGRGLPTHPRLKCLGPILPVDMPQVYQKFDMLLFPTVREGFSMAALEAMACGLPLVATHCSSFPELVIEGKSGYLCPLGDVDAFAEKINFLANNLTTLKEMGQYNRNQIETRFTLTEMIKAYRDLFELVLA